MKEATETIPDTLPEDSDLLKGEQQYLFEDELLVLAEELARITTQQSKLADQKNTCKEAIMKQMKTLNKERGQAELKDEQKIEYWIEEVLKTKKVVAT